MKVLGMTSSFEKVYIYFKMKVYITILSVLFFFFFVVHDKGITAVNIKIDNSD